MRKAVYADVQLTGADSSVLTRILKKKKRLEINRDIEDDMGRGYSV